MAIKSIRGAQIVHAMPFFRGQLSLIAAYLYWEGKEMTLMVRANRLANGEWIDLDFPCPSGGEPTLAGFEATRFNFYGSDKAKQLGLKILPQLAKNNIYAEGTEELDALRAEVQILLDSLNSSDDYWPFRLGNILRAIERAKQYGDAGRVIIF